MRYFTKLNALNVTYLFVLFILISGCTGTRSSTGSSGVDYTVSYHPLVYNAELQIVEQNFPDALNTYKQAFAVVPEPFAIDLYNAAVCAALSEDRKQAFNFLDKLALKGVSIDYIAKQDVFAPLQETKEWEKFQKSYKKNRARFNRRADLDLRADLDELYARDQYFRQAKGGLKVHADTIKKIEDMNAEFLLATIEKYGYPGESLIGVADTLEQLPRFSIVIQRQSKARQGYNFESILKEAVQNGRIRPQAAAYLLEQQGQGNFKTRVLVTVDCNNPKNCEGAGVDGKFFRDRLSASQLEELDENRKQLGLSSFPDYRKKVLYNARDNRFKLSSYWSVTRYVVPSKEAVSALMQGRVEANMND